MKKNLITIFAIILVIVLLSMGINIQSVDEYYLSHIDDITPDSETIFLSIDCSTILKNWDKLNPALQSEKYVPKDGKIIKKTEYVLRKGDTVYSILDRVVRYNRIHMETNNNGTIYIKGINHIYEFSCGPLSGWMYRVNGKWASYDCGKYVLKDGDIVEWIYTCDLGNDVGNSWEG